MNILGLSTFADSSAAIVSGGKVVCAVEEERLNRIKHYEGMPWLAINECLEIAGMSLQDIDIIAIGWNPYLGWKARISETAKSLFLSLGAFGGKVIRGNSYLKGCWELLRLKKSLAERFGGSQVRQEIRFVPHHLAHAASTYLASAYDAANIMVADGVAESATISFFKGESNRISQVGRIDLPHSLGHLYASVTGFLGFRMTHDEGKTMALAAHGDGSYQDLFEKLVQVDTEKKMIKVDTKILDYHAARRGVFSQKWSDLTKLRPRKPNEPLNKAHKDLACSLQNCLEEKVLLLLRRYFPEAGLIPLCAGGGLFLNSVLNGRILRDYSRQYFVQPAAGDNGVSLGAALYISSAIDSDFQRQPMTDTFFGREYQQTEIEQVLDKESVPYKKSGDVFAEAAELIAQGNVIGWYRGRMEFGPRALGNRSILANPMRPEIKNIVNCKVKHREEFRPFAASVMLEDVSEYFEDAQESPFMLKVFHFKEKYKNAFPAVSHCDDSCRFQTVAATHDLHRLLGEIKKRTGYGMVLNTSMNVAGDPIVNTPGEAIELLKKTEIDYMILGDYVLEKQRHGHNIVLELDETIASQGSH